MIDKIPKTVFVDLFALSPHNSQTCLTYNPEQQEQEPAQQSASIMEIFHMKIEEYKEGNLTSPIWIWFSKASVYFWIEHVT